MSKVTQIKIENLKAINSFEADFKGCTAIVTASNNQGKTTFLRSIPDRIRFVRPEVMVKKGSTQGKGSMTLDTGERFEWVFNVDGKDTLTYFTKEGAKRSVTTDLGARFFPSPFDIDKFLQSTPKEQNKQLQKILGVDFTDIDKRYSAAYQNRTDKNRDAEKYAVKLSELMEVPKVDFVDVDKLREKRKAEADRLNKLFLENKAANNELRNSWNTAKQQVTDSENKRVLDLYNENKAINDRNRKAWEQECGRLMDEVNKSIMDRSNKQINYDNGVKACSVLEEIGYDIAPVQKFLTGLRDAIGDELIYVEPAEPEYLQEKFEPVYNYPPEPEYITELPDSSSIEEIDGQIFQAVQINQKAQAYKDYIEYKETVSAAKAEAQAADDAVKAIEDERKKLIQSAKFPAGIDITPDGITVDGFPLDRNQISTSKLYTAALRIAAMNLGEVKTLYFDASFLDRKSLEEIQVWANENDLQLLIERPSWEPQELQYEIIELTGDKSGAGVTKELFEQEKAA